MCEPVVHNYSEGTDLEWRQYVDVTIEPDVRVVWDDFTKTPEDGEGGEEAAMKMCRRSGRRLGEAKRVGKRSNSSAGFHRHGHTRRTPPPSAAGKRKANLQTFTSTERVGLAFPVGLARLPGLQRNARGRRKLASRRPSARGRGVVEVGELVNCA